MKPGTLVVLITHGGFILTDEVPPVGAVGEVVDPTPYHTSNLISLSSVAVSFPRHPSPGRNLPAFGIPPSWLIPINDPDIDLSEETEDNLNEELVEH